MRLSAAHRHHQTDWRGFRRGVARVLAKMLLAFTLSSFAACGLVTLLAHHG